MAVSSPPAGFLAARVLRSLRARLIKYYLDNWRIRLILFDMEVGKRTFRDTTRFTEHLRGRYFLYRARLLAPRADPEGSGAKAWALGYRRLGRVLPENRMREIRAKLDAALSSERAERTEFKGRVVMSAIQQASLVVPELMDCLTEDVQRAVSEYYRCNYRLYNVGAWRTWHVPGISFQDDTLSNNWHTDLRRVDMVKVFVTASDVTEEDGPTHVLDRHWTREVVRRGFRHRRDYQVPVEFIENPEHLVRLTGPAGTALLVNTNLCFHRAGVPAEGHTRDIIEFRFIASPVQSLQLPAESELPLRDRVAS